MTVSQDDINAMLNEELLARRTKVMFLRNAGATWPTIAEETGVSEATCRKDYAVVCRDINAEQPANVVARHRAVIFDIQRANYPAMMRGDKDAAATILRALDRESKLLGLDAPTKIMASVSGEEFANEAARLIARINQLDPNTLKELERVQRRNDPTIIDADIEPSAEPVGAPPAEGAPGDGGGDATGSAVPVHAPDDATAASERHEAGRAADVQGPASHAVDPLDWSNIGDDDE